jgi:hypothetical protein
LRIAKPQIQPSLLGPCEDLGHALGDSLVNDFGTQTAPREVFEVDVFRDRTGTTIAAITSRNWLAAAFCARLPRGRRPQKTRFQPDIRTKRRRSRLSHHRWHGLN